MEGSTWAMTEVPHTPTQLQFMQSADLAFLSKPDPPLVVTQHTEPPQKFVLLSGKVSMQEQGGFVSIDS